jgi:hypothetical protein
MEMLNRNRRDVLKGAAAAAAASLAPTVWTSVSAAAVGRKAGAIAIDKVLSDAVQEKRNAKLERLDVHNDNCRSTCKRLSPKAAWDLSSHNA